MATSSLHQGPQTNLSSKHFPGNQVSTANLNSNAGNLQFQQTRMPDHSMQPGYPNNNQWARRPSPMQSPPGMIPRPPIQQSPLSSPQGNQMLAPKSMSLTNPSTMENKGPMPDPPLNSDFSLDSLLTDPMDSGGSFMQQLQDINTSGSNDQKKATVGENVNKLVDTLTNIQQVQPTHVNKNFNQQVPLSNTPNHILPKQPTNSTIKNMKNNEIMFSNANIKPHESNRAGTILPESNMSLAPQPLPTLENIKYNNNNKHPQSIKNQPVSTIALLVSQSIASTAVMSSPTNNAFTTTCTTPNSNMSTIKTSLPDIVCTTQSLFPPVSSTIPIQSSINSMPTAPTTVSTNSQSIQNQASNQITSPSSTTDLLSPNAPKQVISNSVDAQSQPQFSSVSTVAPPHSNTIPMRPKNELYPQAGEIPNSLPVNSKFSGSSTVQYQPTSMASTPQVPYTASATASVTTPAGSTPNAPTSAPPVPHIAGSNMRPQIQTRMLPPLAMQGPNFPHGGPVDPRMPNQLPRGPAPDGSLGYRHMGPQPGMPNAQYPPHPPHGHPQGPRPYSYPPRPYNPNMPPQMNYMPRPGQMGGPPMHYGPQGAVF